MDNDIYIYIIIIQKNKLYRLYKLNKCIKINPPNVIDYYFAL